MESADEKAATEALLATHAAVICKHRQNDAVFIRQVGRRAVFLVYYICFITVLRLLLFLLVDSWSILRCQILQRLLCRAAVTCWRNAQAQNILL